jgi:hypothetical protein
MGDDLLALATLPLEKNSNIHCIGDFGAHSQSGHFREEKNLLALLEFETQTSQAVAYSLY